MSRKTKRWLLSGLLLLTAGFAALNMLAYNHARATLTEARRVFDAAPGVKEFRSFPDTGHESYAARYPEEWRSAVEEFLKKQSGIQLKISN